MAMVDMKLVFWNVRSLGDVSKRALVRQDLGDIRARWVTLQETKLRVVDGWLVKQICEQED